MSKNWGFHTVWWFVRRQLPCGLGTGASLRIAQLPDDVFREPFFNLSVPWDRLRNAGERIAIPVVLATMSHEDTSKPLNRSDQVNPFHGTVSSSTLRMLGTVPLVRS